MASCYFLVGASSKNQRESWMYWQLPFKVARMAGLLLLVGNAWADIPPLGGFLPGAAQPEVVGKALTKEHAPANLPTNLPTLAAPKEAPSGLSAEAQKIKFQLNDIVLEGNHVYSAAELRPLYQNKLHKVITIAELFEIVQSITNYYRNNGYILSRALLPPQHVKNGVVRVRIVEGFIGNITVAGTPHNATSQVQAIGNRIKVCRPLRLDRLEKYLLLENEIPETTVKAVLAPSKTKTGAADLTLITNNKPITGYASYDNYGTRYLGPQQMTANLQFNSWIFSGDASQITFTKTPKGGELTYIDINENMPVDDEGDHLLLGGTRVHTHPLFVLQPSDIDGLNNNYYGMAFFPMRRTRSESFTLRAGFNYLDSEVTTIADIQLYTDHIRSLDIGETYNFTDNWYGNNTISADFRQGLPILGYTSNYNPATAKTSRPGGRGDYTKLAATLSRLQAIHGPVSLYGVFQGQWAANPLLAAEQFTFGGSQLGRGYDVAELIADRGIAAGLELRYDVVVEKLLVQAVQFYIFSDAAIVWNRKNIPGTQRKDDAISAGVGMRFFMTKYITGNVMWAQPITRKVLAEEEQKQIIVNGQVHNDGNGSAPRVFFSIVASLD